MCPAAEFRVYALTGQQYHLVANVPLLVADFMQIVEKATGIPSCEMRLLVGTRELRWQDLLRSSSDLTVLRDAQAKQTWVHTVGVAGLQLKHAPAEFKRDRAVVAAAVANTGHALRFASDELRADLELVLIAVRRSPGARRWVAKSLKRHPDVWEAANCLAPNAKQNVELQ